MGSRHVRGLLPVALLVALAVGGCVGTLPQPGATVEPDTSDAGYDTSRAWSQPTDPAKYDVLPGLERRLTSFDGTELAVGLFLPEIPGCDWDASELPDRCRVPVVMDAGPYWADAEETRSFRPPLVEWLVPRGYAVAHLSIRGTGESEGCMEFMSPAEQRDVSETVTWLAERPWSNGNVGMMGRSYDGTTPFMAAAQGNPHLKTIVPISGVASVPDLMFKNGTSESRGPIMHSVVYWTLFGVGAIYGPDAASFRGDHWTEQACESFVVGTAEGPRAALTGDTGTEYWEARDFRQRILDNYNGSAWIVHGLHDWNVNPSQVVPWIDRLKQDPDIETRAWLGVWGHAYPDRVDEHRNVRWDFAQEVVDWFDHELKDEGPQPELAVEVEDSLFTWRTEETYPPDDAAWSRHDVPSGTVAAGRALTHATEPLDDDLRIAGLPRLHLDVTPTTTTGGYLFAELYDVFPDGQSMRIGWAAIDLRYHDGGNTDPATLVPGQTVTAEMQFEPTDAHVGEGHRLRLVVHRDAVEDIPSSYDPSPVAVEGGTLSLPTIDRTDTVQTAPGA